MTDILLFVRHQKQLFKGPAADADPFQLPHIRHPTAACCAHLRRQRFTHRTLASILTMQCNTGQKNKSLSPHISFQRPQTHTLHETLKNPPKQNTDWLSEPIGASIKCLSNRISYSGKEDIFSEDDTENFARFSAFSTFSLSYSSVSRSSSTLRPLIKANVTPSIFVRATRALSMVSAHPSPLPV